MQNISPHNEDFFRLIRISTGTSPATMGRRLSESEWERLYESASKQGLLGVLLRSIEVLPISERPPMSLALNWLSNLTVIQNNNELIRNHTQELEAIFSGSGFRIHVLKGSNFAQYYPDPSTRLSSDIDLWVDGERKDIIKFLKNKVRLEEIVYHHCEAKFFQDLKVEIHYRPTWFFNPVFNHRFTIFCGQHRESVFNNDERQDKVFDLVYGMVHIFRHIFSEGVGLRHLMDIYYILKSTDSDDRKEACKTLETLGLSSFTGAIMNIEKKVFGLSDEYALTPEVVLSDRQHLKVESLSEKLLDEILQTGNFGKDDARRETKLKKAYRFSRDFPRESSWALPWRIWHLVWRATHNLIKF